MYRVNWDPETGGVLLSEERDASSSSEVRPVFHEELDLLGFDRHWDYARAAAPLLWAQGRRYFYRGRPVAKASGGGFFEKPKIQYIDKELELEPVDVAGMIARNAPLLEGLVYRSLEFIRREYEVRKDEVDIASVAFSGGKDSLVTLDLVQRALPPDAFVVVFDDTTMELSATYEAVERAKAHYSHLRFYTARSEMPATETWRLFGPPSRIHRWCSRVHKTVPNLLLLRTLMDSSSLRALVYDGVRRAESQRRSAYLHVTAEEKNGRQVNASAVLEWSSCETHLYLCQRYAHMVSEQPLLNSAYRYGISRVGCCVCPYNSMWSETIVGHVYSEDAAPLLGELEKYASRAEIPPDEVRGYISEGRWKTRSGGRAIDGGGNRVIERASADGLAYLIKNPSESWQEWAKAMGTPVLEGPNQGRLIEGEREIAFSTADHGKDLEILIPHASQYDRFTRRDLKSLAYKAGYCVRCGACEAECPTGALRVNGRVTIDLDLCSHCGKCLSLVDKGCWRAKSITVSKRGKGMKGINAYQTFGLSTGWLGEYLRDPVRWWSQNSLGTRQFDAVRVWLGQSGIIDRANKMITKVGERLQVYGEQDRLTWMVIWTNLAINSVLVRWYVTELPFGRAYSRAELLDRLGDSSSQRTRSNAIVSLANLLEKTPLGGEMRLGSVTRKGRAIQAIGKPGQAALPALGFLYCLYRRAEGDDRYSFSVSELSAPGTGGPTDLFGVQPSDLVRCLRGLSSRHPAFVRVEILRGLDNVYLEPTHASEEVLSLDRQ